MKKLAASLFVALMLTGCVTGWMGPQPLSSRWANEQRQQRDVAARREHIGKPLFGRPDSGQDAKPGAIFGGEHGLRAELQGTRGGSVQYRFSW